MNAFEPPPPPTAEPARDGFCPVHREQDTP